MEVENAERKSGTRKVIPAPAWLGKRIGRFKLVALLGQGAMGRVFRAEDVQLQRQVALKVLPLQFKFGGKTIGLEQFVREARSVAALDHPGVVQVYEVNQTHEVFYIAMELVEGGNLRDLVRASGPLDVLRACQLGAEAAEALGHAHQMGIVHRDVKPANLMLSRGGRCKLSDFGLARIDDPGDSFRLGVESVGTPLYMAPEVARGTPAEAASDIYSLAATVYFLLCGRPPFDGQTPREVMEQHISAPVPDLREWQPDLPAGLAETIAKGMAKKPRDRFASAELFGSALRVHTIPLGGSMSGSAAISMVGGSGSGSIGSLAGVGTSGAMLTVKSAEWRQRRGLLIGAGTAVGLLVAGGIYFLVASQSSHPGSANASASVAPADSTANTPAASPVLAAATNAPVQTPAELPVVNSSTVLTVSVAPTPKFLAVDYAALLAIASDPKNPLAFKSITVEGTPKKTHFTSSGNMRLTFVGADDDAGFQLFCPDSVLKEMQAQFGGTNGEGIIGHKIAVQGVVSLNKGRPQIRIESAKQISLMQ